MGLKNMFRTNIGINDNQDPDLASSLLRAHSLLRYAGENKDCPLCAELTNATAVYRAFVKNVYLRVLNTDGGDTADYTSACASKDPARLIDSEIKLTADSPRAHALRMNILRAAKALQQGRDIDLMEPIFTHRAILVDKRSP